MFVNLTPHPISIIRDGVKLTVTPTAPPARVQQFAAAPAGDADGVPIVTAPEFGEIENLPAPVAGTWFIVSALVAGRCVGRSDVVAPATGPADGAIRDAAGCITAVTRLVAAPRGR